MRLKFPQLRPRGCTIESLESRTMLSLAGQIVGYIPDYEFGNFSKIDLTAVTHLNYSALVANADGSLATTSNSGYPLSQLTTVVNAAHAASPRVSVSITIATSSAFQTIADSSSLTGTFITNILAFCSTYHLDGIDLDYEPGTLGSSDITSWGNFLVALHAQTAAHGLTLSEAVQASQDIVPTADYSDLDWFYLMDYDLEYNSSAPVSDWNSYLTDWTNYGVPKSKLVVGVPFYGRAGTGWDNSQTMTYASILSGYASANSGALPAPSVDSITLQTTVNKVVVNTTWGFDSISDMKQDANYILQNGYGGMMIWELGQDQFTSTGYGQDALLPAIKSAFTLPLTASADASYTLTSTALTITSGTLTATGDLSTIDPNLGVTVGGGASLILNSTEQFPSLTLNGGTASATAGSGVVVLGSLSITNGGSLDLQNNDLIVHSGNLTAITALIAQGLNFSNGGHWNGTGITSSTAAAAATGALGVELNSDGSNANRGLGNPLMTTFDNQTVTETDVLVKYTTFGDADLSTHVDAADYLLLDNGFNSNGVLTGWRNGDFNYDGVINGDDYTLIDNAYNTQAAENLAQPASLLLATIPLAIPSKSRIPNALLPTPTEDSPAAANENPFAAPQDLSVDDILAAAIRD